MKRLLLVSCLSLPLAAAAQQQEIQRALIQRDQQSAEFAARLRGADVRPLENLHAQQLREALSPLSPDPGVAQPLLPYQRGVMAQERQRFASPVFETPPGPPAEVRRPLPLPGGPQSGVDPIGAQGVAH